MKKEVLTWAVLCGVCLGGGALVHLVGQQTAGQIQLQKNAALNEAAAGVLGGADHYEELAVRESSYAVEKAYQALDAEGNILGYVGKMTVTGYGGPIEVTAGLNAEGVITGISVGGENFAETAGLGARTQEAAFTDQFIGKTPAITPGKDGVDCVSGASISSRAVISGVNTIANYFYTGELGLADEVEEVYEGQTISCVKKGFGGDVTVTVGLAEDGRVEYLAIDTPGETDGLGKLASEKAFTSQFIGKAAPFRYGEDGIDALTGATITSDAVLAALNELVPGGEMAPAAAIKETEAEGGDASKYMRERPAAAGGEKAEGGDASKYMRERPAAAGGEKAEGGDASKYMRERPAAAGGEKAEGGDASKYMRERPAAAANGEAEAFESESGDASKYMRERPAAAADGEAEEAEPNGAESGDASKYMRERPAAAAGGEPEAAEEDNSGDAAKYMRPRPAD